MKVVDEYADLRRALFVATIQSFIDWEARRSTPTKHQKESYFFRSQTAMIKNFVPPAHFGRRMIHSPAHHK